MNFLKRLFSKKVEEAPEPPPEFLQENPPDWLIDLKGRGLPSGGAFSIRVQLFKDDRTGNADFLRSSGNDGNQPKSAAASLDRPEIDRLFVILGFTFPDDIISVPPGVKDGCPVKISIYRREPQSVKTGHCNLAGWLDTKKSKPPVVEIGLLLLDIQTRAFPA